MVACVSPGDGADVSGWSYFPKDGGVDHSALAEVGDDGERLDGSSVAAVVGLGALCGLSPRRADQDERTRSFWVAEFVLLADGRRIILHDERGFTIGARGAGSGLSMSPADITHNVLNVVLPDDDESGEAHPWPWLAALARARGLDVSAEQLSSLPYTVVLTAELADGIH